MTSVPKPLKFLNPNYPKMREIFEKQSDSEFKVGSRVPFLATKFNQNFSKVINQRMVSIIGFVCRHPLACRNGQL